MAAAATNLARQNCIPKTLRLRDANKDVETEHALCAVSTSVARAKRILLVTGAGISCNAGIPDFRSEDGLYAMVKKEYPTAVVKGRDLFDAILFNSPVSVSVFCTFMARLRSCMLRARSTAAHKFIKHLYDCNRLLRCYTQNIDGLEGQDGLRLGVEGKSAEVVQLHGDIHMLKCTFCGLKVSWSKEQHDALESGNVPECHICSEKAEERTNAGKRCPRVGGLLPNIVLYGEEHPDGDVIGRCIDSDIKSRPDCLIIVGTSLKVIGVKKLIRKMAKAVHDRGGVVIFVNKGSLAVSSWKGVIDYHIETDCDEWIDDLRRRQPSLFLKQSTLPLRPTKPAKIKPRQKQDSIILAGQGNASQKPACRENISRDPAATRITSTKKRKAETDTDLVCGINNTNQARPLKRTSGLTTEEFDDALAARMRSILKTKELENIINISTG
ncbi:DHS-like NAD/FAD-binding domain-containing protein [Lipomyces kononenkoae]|uniref:DHS-like NAD/FAD-binding domain-containing protein n=1 Tax=Lipomyces kononenkoae TaxID=34357 RepID=A0ACC3TAT3_LIPKO